MRKYQHELVANNVDIPSAVIERQLVEVCILGIVEVCGGTDDWSHSTESEQQKDVSGIA